MYRIYLQDNIHLNFHLIDNLLTIDNSFIIRLYHIQVFMFEPTPRIKIDKNLEKITIPNFKLCVKLSM